MAIHKGMCVGGPEDGKLVVHDGPDFLVMRLQTTDIKDVSTPVEPSSHRYHWDGQCWRHHK